MDEITKVRRKRSRSTRHFDFGSHVGCLLRDILPAQVCAIAATTCRFELRGLRANGNEWGLGVITRAQTYRHAPQGVGLPGQPALQHQGDWIETTAHEAANVFLGCFGLTIETVYDHFGRPANGERIVLDLMEIVQALAPDLMPQASTAVA